MDLVEYAKSELERAGLFGEGDFYGGMAGEAVMELVEVFAEQGHSGMSASLVRQIFNTVSKFEPLSPLTGEDDEWKEVEEGKYQNKRCSRVFKDINGLAYDIEGRVFCKKDGVRYTSRESRVAVTFPYVPHTEYVEVDDD